MKINKRQFKKWIAALDSGEYKQTKYLLQLGDSHCCLGVGCKVTIPRKQLKVCIKGELVGQKPDRQPAAPEWLKEIDSDFKFRTGMSLTELNDYGIGYGNLGQGVEGFPPFAFPEIATLLELVYIHKILD